MWRIEARVDEGPGLPTSPKPQNSPKNTGNELFVTVLQRQSAREPVCTRRKHVAILEKSWIFGILEILMISMVPGGSGGSGRPGRV